MKTILRVRNLGKPEPEPLVVLDNWLEETVHGMVRWHVRERGTSNRDVLASLSPDGICHTPGLPPSLGLPLKKDGSIAFQGRDGKAEAFEELLEACKEGQRLYTTEIDGVYGLVANAPECGRWINQIRDAIAKADELIG